MQERRIDFQLFGQEFSFYSDAPDEEIRQVIALLKEEFASQEKAGTKILPSTTVLVFGCLRMAARVVQERARFQALLANQERSIEAIIDKIVSHLD